MDQVIKGSGLVIVKGRSMSPFLKDGDALVMMPVKNEDIHIGDIVICKLEDRFFARRVFRKNEDSIEIGPDVRPVGASVKREALLGKVVERKRKGSSINCQAQRWGVYTRYILLNYSMRKIVKMVCGSTADILKRCVGLKHYFILRNLLAGIVGKLPLGVVRWLKDILY